MNLEATHAHTFTWYELHFSLFGSVTCICCSNYCTLSRSPHTNDVNSAVKINYIDLDQNIFIYNTIAIQIVIHDCHTLYGRSGMVQLVEYKLLFLNTSQCESGGVCHNGEWRRQWHPFGTETRYCCACLH